MEPFIGTFRFLAKPHAVTQGFVLFRRDRNINSNTNSYRCMWCV